MCRSKVEVTFVTMAVFQQADFGISPLKRPSSYTGRTIYPRKANYFYIRGKTPEMAFTRLAHHYNTALPAIQCSIASMEVITKDPCQSVLALAAPPMATRSSGGLGAMTHLGCVSVGLRRDASVGSRKHCPSKPQCTTTRQAASSCNLEYYPHLLSLGTRNPLCRTQTSLATNWFCASK